MSRTELWVRPEVIDLVRDKFRGQSIALPGGGEIVFGVCDAVERREPAEGYALVAWVHPDSIVHYCSALELLDRYKRAEGSPPPPVTGWLSRAWGFEVRESDVVPAPAPERTDAVVVNPVREYVTPDGEVVQVEAPSAPPRRFEARAVPPFGHAVFDLRRGMLATEQTLGLSSEQAARIADQLEHAGLGPVVSS